MTDVYNYAVSVLKLATACKKGRVVDVDNISLLLRFHIPVLCHLVEIYENSNQDLIAISGEGDEILTEIDAHNMSCIAATAKLKTGQIAKFALGRFKNEKPPPYAS